MPINQPFSYRTLPAGVKALIVANIAVYLVQMFMGPKIIFYLGLYPARVLRDLWLWQPVTYMFLHGGIFHLLLNMYILWAFGKEIEFRWGTGRFLYYYFLCGLGAAFFNVLLMPGSTHPSIGASGAIYGLLVAFAVIYPSAVLYMYFLIPMRVWHVVIFLAAIEFLAGFSGTSSGVANLAHLGGLLTGYVYLKGGRFWERVRSDTFVLGGRAVRWQRRREGRLHDVDEEADRILEKILKKGVNSLNSEEKEFMDRYSQSKRGER